MVSYQYSRLLDETGVLNLHTIIADTWMLSLALLALVAGAVFAVIKLNKTLSYAMGIVFVLSALALIAADMGCRCATTYFRCVCNNGSACSALYV